MTMNNAISRIDCDRVAIKIIHAAMPHRMECIYNREKSYKNNLKQEIKFVESRIKLLEHKMCRMDYQTKKKAEETIAGQKEILEEFKNDLHKWIGMTEEERWIATNQPGE